MADIEQRAQELLDAHCPIDYNRALTGANVAIFKRAALDAIIAALASQPQAPAVAEDATSPGFLFNLVKECRSYVRRTGIRGDDYGLCHESRMLALRYERGDFNKAMEMCKALADGDRQLMDSTHLRAYCTERIEEANRQRWAAGQGGDERGEALANAKRKAYEDVQALIDSKAVRNG